MVSLQRHDDTVTRPKSAADLERNTITISQGKAENYKTPINLEIEMGDALRAAVSEYIRSPVVCPYPINCTPKKRSRK